ncbi:MAG: polymerase, sigma-24 subunit, subfamily [Labilithrix sp.]|nr:polymerase, sigma-24 subunit, subfamily [Labilithrix sp.]
MLSRGLSADEVSDVYHRYGALLERRCRLLMRDHAHAEDALQELLATLLRRGEAFREAASPYRWLCRAADRTCLDLLRRGKRVREALSSDGLATLDPLGPAPGVDAEARLAALQSLGQLDVEQQELAIMLFVDGMSQSEAAAELGVSRVTINKRTQRIRSQLGLAAQVDQEEASS